MANESKIEVIGNYLVITDLTTREEYLRKPKGAVSYHRTDADVFYFTDNIATGNSADLQNAFVLGVKADGSGRAYHAFADTVDSTGAAWTNADTLEAFLAAETGFFLGSSNQDVNIHDAAGNDLTSTLVGSDQALDVNVVQSSGSSAVQDVALADSANLDAFSRLRVSQLTTQIDVKQLHDNLPLFIDEETIGTGSAVHSTTLAQSSLTTAASSDAVILQTKQRMNYQSGKSQLLFWTFNNFDVETNITKRVGYFSSNTSTPFNSTLDGIFLESDGTTHRIKVYRSGTEIDNVARSSWDDPLDGTGASGINIDFSKNTILVVDFQWLGVGRIRFYYESNGSPVLFHEIDHTDIEGVYMSSPNQPLRWEIRQTGAGSGTFNIICSSVNSEGSINKLGKILSENLGTAHVNANLTTLKYALLGIRLKSTHVDTLIDLINFSLLTITNDNQLVEVWLNPSVAGTFTYNGVTNSSVEIAKGASAGTNTVTGGTLLYSKYVSAQDATPIDLENALRLGMTIAGVLDEIVITTNPLTSNSDVLASMDWRELT